MKVINTALAVILALLGYYSYIDGSDLRYQIDLLAQQTASLINAIPLPEGHESEDISSYEESEEETTEDVVANSLNMAHSKLNEIKDLSKNTHYQMYGQRAINQLMATLALKC